LTKNFLANSPFIPVWARGWDATVFFIYNGFSMKPLFKPGDLLCARRVSWEEITVGDVVIFSSSHRLDRVGYIVHRVVSLKQDGLITQGDNNFLSDEQIVSERNLIGLVVYSNRRGCVYKVKGGTMGLFYFYLIYLRNHIWSYLKYMGKGLYFRLRQGGWVNKVWQPKIIKIQLITDTGRLVKFCFNNYTVARWWPETGQFDVIKPFDLVITRPSEA